MRPTEFDENTAIAAGEELLASGVVNITGFALRQQIGGGTPTKLKKMWDNYLTTKHIDNTTASTELPNQVTEVLTRITKAHTEQLARIAKELNAIAVKSAEARIEELLKKQVEKDQQNTAEVTEATAAFEDMAAKLESVQAKNESLEEKLAQTIAERDAAHHETIQAREIAAKLSGQLEAITAQNTKLLTALEPKKK